MFAIAGASAADDVATTMWRVGATAMQSANAVTRSPVSLCPPKAASAVHVRGSGVPSASGSPLPGREPLSLRLVLGAPAPARAASAPPPDSALPAGQRATAGAAWPGAIVSGAPTAYAATGAGYASVPETTDAAPSAHEPAATAALFASPE